MKRLEWLVLIFWSSYLVFDAHFDNPKLGDFDTELVEEFFQALAFNLQMNLHLKILHGKNSHHKSESFIQGYWSCFYREAITINPEIQGG